MHTTGRTTQHGFVPGCNSRGKHVQLESHASPHRESPPQRYAALHRAIDRGLDGDGVWRELAKVCLELGLNEEAAQCARHLRCPEARMDLEAQLSCHPGLWDQYPAAAGHFTAPAASDAGTTESKPPSVLGTSSHDRLQGLGEHLTDAVQFLGQQHLPWLVLLCTLAFPVVIGLGGMLTGGDSPWLLGTLQSLPGLAVFAMVGAMARRILRDSAAGESDVPRLGALGSLAGDALRGVADTALVLACLLGPGLLAAAVKAPWTTTVPSLAIGAYFAPLALGLRHVRGDLIALSPVTLLRGAMRTGLAYAALAIVHLALFLPAATAIWLVAGRPLWVQIAALGPLLVLPVFFAARLLGTWLDGMRQELGTVLATRKTASRPAGQLVASESAADAAQPRQPRRPQQLAHFDAPPAVPKPRPARKPAPAKPAAPQPKPRAIEGRAPARDTTPAANMQSAIGTDQPDLSCMPGATIVKGADRILHGAASRR
jgi:hypothetical protein